MEANKRRIHSTYSPELESWGDKIEQNKSLGAPLLRDQCKRQEFRKKLLREASAYSTALVTEERAEANSEVIIATGHQPKVYHMGILEKESALTQFQEERMPDATLLNIIIDIDEGSIGSFYYPALESDTEMIKSIKLSDETSIGFLQSAISPEKIEEVFKELLTQAAKLQLDDNALKKTFSLYQEHSQLPLRDLNTAVRRKLLGSNILDLPLSTLIHFDELQDFFVNLVFDYKNLHDTYNQLLDAHRVERKIKNKANPFPNLTTKAFRSELPLWLYDTTKQKRVSLFVSEKNGVFTLSDGESGSEAVEITKENWREKDFILYPKAIFTSIILRYFISELFVHGLGGETYDRFTDKLLTHYFRVPIKEHAIVSSTYSLFPEKLSEYQLQQENINAIQKATNTPQEFYSKGLFPEQMQEELNKLQAEKESIIAKLKELKDKNDMTPFKKQLNDIRNAMKERVTLALTPKKPISKQLGDVYSFRELPFFYFL